MTTPTIHHSALVGIKLHITGKGFRCRSPAGSQKGLFNNDEVCMATGPVFILKGEIAVMLLAQLGCKACAPTGGEGSDASGYLAALSLPHNIVIGDKDPDPMVREKIVCYGQQRAVVFSAILCFPPEGYKDIDEFLVAVPEGKILLDRWIEEAIEGNPSAAPAPGQPDGLLGETADACRAAGPGQGVGVHAVNEVDHRGAAQGVISCRSIGHGRLRETERRECAVTPQDFFSFRKASIASAVRLTTPSAHSRISPCGIRSKLAGSPQ